MLHHLLVPHSIPIESGGPRATRTPNLLIRSQMLYPIELWDRAKTIERKRTFEKARRV